MAGLRGLLWESDSHMEGREISQKRLLSICLTESVLSPKVSRDDQELVIIKLPGVILYFVQNTTLGSIEARQVVKDLGCSFFIPVPSRAKSLQFLLRLGIIGRGQHRPSLEHGFRPYNPVILYI